MANDLEVWLLKTLRKRRRRERRQSFLTTFGFTLLVGLGLSLTYFFKALGLNFTLGLISTGLVIATITLVSIFIIQIRNSG